MTLLTKIKRTRQFLYQGVRAFNRNNTDNRSSEQNSTEQQEQYSTQQNRIDRDSSEQSRKNTE